MLDNNKKKNKRKFMKITQNNPPLLDYKPSVVHVA